MADGMDMEPKKSPRATVLSEAKHGLFVSVLIGGAGVILAGFAAFASVSSTVDVWLWQLIIQSRPTNDYFDPSRLLVIWGLLGAWLIAVGVSLTVWRRAAFAAPAIDNAAFAATAAATVVMILYTTFHLSWVAFPDWVWREDGFFEYLTVGILVVSSVCMFASARRIGGRHGRWPRLVLLGFGVLLFLAAMEEISWGQRILGIETPEPLKAVNAQEEINVHNLFVGYNEVIRMVLALCISSAFLIAARRPRWLDRLKLNAILPDGRYFYFPIVLIPAHIYDEMFEQVLSFLILFYATDIAVRAFGLGWSRHGSLRKPSSYPAE